MTRQFKRVWGSQSDEIDWTADVIVGIPESLSPRLESSDDPDKERLKTTVIDEAHHSVEPVYKEIFKVSSGNVYRSNGDTRFIEQCANTRVARTLCKAFTPCPITGKRTVG